MKAPAILFALAGFALLIGGEYIDGLQWLALALLFALQDRPAR